MSDEVLVHWYNNGVKQHKFREDEVPDGWVLGLIPKTEEQKKVIREKVKKTIKERYGVDSIWELDEVRNKSKLTCLEKYGCESPNQSEEVKKKKEESMLEKYGVKHALQSKEFNEKAKKTSLERYGTEYAIQSDAIKERQINSMLEKYGVENPSQSPEIQQKKIETNMRKYGTEYYYQSEDFKTKSKATCLERYGVDNAAKSEIIKERVRETNRKMFGADYISQTDEYKERVKKTSLEHWGTESPMQSEEVKSRVKNTSKKRYGNEWAIASDHVRKLSRETHIKRYGVEYALQSRDIFERMLERNLDKWGTEYPIRLKEVQDKAKKTNLERYGYEYAFMDPKYRLMGYSKNDSVPNKEFASLLVSNGVLNFEKEFCVSGRRFFDFKVGNTLIEVDPYPTHNSLWGIYEKDFGLDPDYHKEKSVLAMSHGYQVIHIFDWDDKQKIVNLLKPRETVYARKCELREVSREETEEFLQKYHLQGPCRGQEIRLGLYYKNELVSLMTFGPSRYNKNYQYELLRYCSSKNVIGGAQKLFTHFIREFNPESIISYCDKSKFRGDVYTKLGFRLLTDGKPSCHWYNMVDGKHFTATLVRQRGVDQLLGTSYGKGTSNEELLIKHNFVPIYDCGQDTYVYSSNIC